VKRAGPTATGPNDQFWHWTQLNNGNYILTINKYTINKKKENYH
jgi:hypothetical protein